jgi:hypothetical protein
MKTKATKASATAAQVPSDSGHMPVWDQDRLLKISHALHGIGGSLNCVDGEMEVDAINGIGSALRLLAWDLEEIHERAAYVPEQAAKGGAR